MKYWVWILLCLFVFGAAAFIPEAKPKPFAIVELFTAEGCSSCPPADELLKEMTDILRKEGKEVFSLSFHVTYWNKNGWEDSYSQEIFTDRQKKYAQSISDEQLYTPQAIVNGEKEFIGSNPIAFREAVMSAVSKSPTVEIKASASIEKNNLVVGYKSNQAPATYVVNIALVETSVVHFIPRGENKSRTLKHYNIVRSFSTSSLKAMDSVVSPWPKGLVASNSSVILYVQHPKSLRIVGATRVEMK
jgi:hypothetical protein